MRRIETTRHIVYFRDVRNVDSEQYLTLIE